MIELNDEVPYVNFIIVYDISFFFNDEEINENDIADFLYEYLHKVLFENGVGYSGDNSYKIKLPTENSFNLDNSNLTNVIIKLPDLSNINLDEKGYKNRIYNVVNQEFHPDSVFYLVDQLKANGNPNPTRSELGPFAPHIPNVDLVINTDMGTEPADFILSSKNRLIYVHVKCGTTVNPQSSAGSLAQVGSQAIKNMEMLMSSDGGLKPGNWNMLSDAWPSSNAVALMNERIRLLDGKHYVANNHQDRIDKLKDAWDIISQRRGSTAVIKEIWIVAAKSFSRSHFKKELLKGQNANSESLQAFQLINSWMSTAHDNDVDIKIFVSP